MQRHNIVVTYKLFKLTFLLVLLGCFPTFVISQEAELPRAATITVAELEVAMFSSDDNLSVFFGSQAKILQALDAAGEIHTVPASSFLIFFVGQGVFANGTLSEDFSQFVGDSILRKLREIPQPTDPCADTTLSFLDGTRGHVVFLDIGVAEPVESEKCVVGGFIDAWTGEPRLEDDVPLGDLVISLVESVRGQG